MEPSVKESPRGAFTKYKKIIYFILLFFIVAGIPTYFFVSHQGFTVSSSNNSTPNDLAEVKEEPDTIRIKQLELIRKKIQDSLKKGQILPLPINALEVTFGKQKMGYQGFAGEDFFDALGLTFLHDPVSGEMYYYYLAPDGKNYQILSFLDNISKGNSIINGHATYSIGTSDKNFLLTSSGELVLSVLKTPQKIDLDEPETVKKLGLDYFKSCQDIRNFSKDLKSGNYTIKLGEKDVLVYCEMKIDDGGWTLFYANNGYPDSPIRMSYLEMRNSLSKTVYRLSDYNDRNLAGLLDYSYFTEHGAKEILIIEKPHWRKISFSSSHALAWALGDSILGNNEGCYRLPRNSTWTISYDWKTSQDHFSYLANLFGLAWGVSTKQHPCNGYDGLNPVGFGIKYTNKENRYFIR